MQKWKSLPTELPPEAVQVLDTVEGYLSNLLMQLERQEPKRVTLFETALSYLRTTTAKWALYGSHAWNYYLPTWLRTEPSDLDVMVLSCQNAQQLKVLANNLFDFLKIMFQGFKFHFRHSVHNGDSTLSILCDKLHFMDLSLCHDNMRPEQDIVHDPSDNTNYLSLDWLLADLEKILALSSANYRQVKDLTRLTKAYNSFCLNQLSGTTQNVINILTRLYTNYLPLLTQYFLNSPSTLAVDSVVKSLTQAKEDAMEVQTDLKIRNQCLEEQVARLSVQVQQLTSDLAVAEGVKVEFDKYRESSKKLVTESGRANGRLKQQNSQKQRLVDEAHQENVLLKAQIKELEEAATLRQTALVEEQAKSADLAARLAAVPKVVKPPPPARTPKKKKNGQKKANQPDHDFDPMIWKHNYDASKVIIKDLEEKKDDLTRKNKTMLLNACQQMDQMRELIASKSKLEVAYEVMSKKASMRINELEAALSDKTADATDTDRDLKIVTVARERIQKKLLECRRRLMTALTALFWQNQVVMVGIEDRTKFGVDELEALGQPVSKKTGQLLTSYCNKCYDLKYSEPNYKGEEKFLFCVYNPIKVNIDNISSLNDLFADTSILQIPFDKNVNLFESKEKGLGIFAVPLSVLTLQKQEEENETFGYLDACQVMDRKDNRIWNLCQDCLLQNLIGVVTRHKHHDFTGLLEKREEIEALIHNPQFDQMDMNDVVGLASALQHMAEVDRCISIEKQLKHITTT